MTKERPLNLDPKTLPNIIIAWPIQDMAAWNLINRNPSDNFSTALTGTDDFNIYFSSPLIEIVDSFLVIIILAYLIFNN